jgi:hypothetical protein
MTVLPEDLLRAAGAARDRLAAFATQTAAAGAGRPASQAALAGAAREAIFSDALAAAMHARLEECKSVAK